MSTDSGRSDNLGEQASVETLCEEAGFPLARIRREGDVLILIPKTLGALPSAETLQDLSDRIQDLGYRYVAFSVDEESVDTEPVDKGS